MPCKVHIHHVQDGFTSLDKYCTQGRIVLPKITMVPLLRNTGSDFPSDAVEGKKKKEMKVQFAQSCPTLCDLMGYYPTSLLCPSNSPGKNPGVGSHSLLQGIFLSQGLNPGLPYCRQGILLQMQGTQVQFLVWRDSMCHRATKPMWHHYWAHALGPASCLLSRRTPTTEPHVWRPCAPQLEKPPQREAHTQRWRVAPACCN